MSPSTVRGMAFLMLQQQKKELERTRVVLSLETNLIKVLTKLLQNKTKNGGVSHLWLIKRATGGWSAASSGRHIL